MTDRIDNGPRLQRGQVPGYPPEYPVPTPVHGLIMTLFPGPYEYPYPPETECTRVGEPWTPANAPTPVHALIYALFPDREAEAS